MNNRDSFFSELTRSRRGRFKFTCQMWWSFCCRYVTVGLEVFRRFSARLDRVRMWNWGRFIFTENSNSSQMLSCPDENRLQFFGWEQGPCYRGTKFFFWPACICSMSKALKCEDPIRLLATQNRVAYHLLYSPSYWIMFQNRAPSKSKKGG